MPRDLADDMKFYTAALLWILVYMGIRIGAFLGLVLLIRWVWLSW